MDSARNPCPLGHKEEFIDQKDSYLTDQPLRGAYSQAQNHKVQSGENDWTIARRYKISLKQLHAFNPKVQWSRLQIGTQLNVGEAQNEKKAAPVAIIPATSTAKPHKAAAEHSSVKTITAGREDNDWTLARRFKLTPPEIRKANPQVVWAKLKPGTKINIPVQESQHKASPKKVAAVKPAAKPIAAKAMPKATTRQTAVVGTYKVTGEDNDWIIARRFKTTPPVIRSMNPDVDWRKLAPGKIVKVPGNSVVATHTSKAADHAIRTHYAVVKGDSVNVRAGGRTNAESILQVDGGTPAVILDREGEWYKLKFPHGTKGWVKGEYLESSKRQPKQFVAYRHDVDETEQPERKIEPKRERIAERHVRDRSEEVARPKRRTETKVARKTEQKATVVAKREARAMRIAKSDSDSPSGDGSSLDRAARSMLGARYRYGAASRSATDCSGYTSQVYRKLGVSLPRTSQEQASVGKSVSRGSLQKGDLVFFKTRGSRISHVGIYVGNNKFIHASSGAGKVRVSELDGYYARRYAGARRVKKFTSKSDSKAAPSKESRQERNDDASTADGA